ncbi:hypothetical protein SFMTTN_0185 [Sulfuriferula multivorans]|uniref:Uncharacterized protein n=1 Tax=Sulfuriferula multivorans TaxID=1559896 RepID=A0A401J9Z2_9PROT|nr:hypothetical protein SFMTTN_0185 [Sulfuriferula multivorans]
MIRLFTLRPFRYFSHPLAPFIEFLVLYLKLNRHNFQGAQFFIFESAH